MSTTLHFAPRPPLPVPVKTGDVPRTLFDRWLERWARVAEARWRRAGDPHSGRYY